MELQGESKYYRLSGKVSPLFFLLVLVGLFLVAVFSYLYAMAMFYNPYIYLSILIAVAFGALIGLIILKAVQWGKARNTIACWIALAISMLVFIYVHFAAYGAVVDREIYDIPETTVWHMILIPSYMYESYIDWIIPYGVWGFGESADSSVSGAFLVCIWVIEHVIVAGLAVLILKAYAFKKPFFEESGKWGTEKECEYGWEPLPATAYASVTNDLENVNIENFRALKAANPTAPHSSGFSCYYDPSGVCSDVYLSVYNMTIEFNNKGQMSKKKENIVEKLRFPGTSYSQLEEIARAAAVASADAYQAQTEQPLQ